MITHVAGLVWFKLIDITKLKGFIHFIDKKGRLELLQTWQNHLAKSEKTMAVEFWRNAIIPYWKWNKDRFLRMPDGNEERFEFWNLLPYSHEAFPETAHIAVGLPPTNIEYMHLFIRNLRGTDLPRQYPGEFVNLLTELIKADNNPQWQMDEWKKLWDAVKDSDVSNLNILRNELARKRII